ncbi:MAG: hypothetical protein ABFS08_12390 [Pseudomonadota bacterium]
MKNSVVASVVFYFKGEKFSPSMQLDLNELMGRNASLANLHHSIAMANSIDAYSYEYEMMMAEDIHFDQAEGWVVEFVKDGQLDMEGFAAKWRELQVLESVRPIAERCVGVADLDAKPKLKAALIEAYMAGKAST